MVLNRIEEYTIRDYFHTCWKLDRANEPSLTPDYEKDLIKKRDILSKIVEKRQLQKHPLFI